MIDIDGKRYRVVTKIGSSYFVEMVGESEPDADECSIGVGDVVRVKGWSHYGIVTHMEGSVATVRFNSGVTERILVNNLTLDEDDEADDTVKLAADMRQLLADVKSVSARLSQLIEAIEEPA